jgi:hypothetical protein
MEIYIGYLGTPIKVTSSEEFYTHFISLCGELYGED